MSFGQSSGIIQKSSENGIGQFCLGTDGSGAANLIVKNGGLRHRYSEKGGLERDNYLCMNGPEIFNFTLESVPKAFQAVLDKNNLRLEEVDYFIFHQANKYMLEHIRQKINIPQEKFYLNISNIGNTVSATIPIAISILQNENKFSYSKKYLLMGFGVGLSVAGCIIS